MLKYLDVFPFIQHYVLSLHGALLPSISNITYYTLQNSTFTGLEYTGLADFNILALPLFLYILKTPGNSHSMIIYNFSH